MQRLEQQYARLRRIEGAYKCCSRRFVFQNRRPREKDKPIHEISKGQPQGVNGLSTVQKEGKRAHARKWIPCLNAVVLSKPIPCGFPKGLWSLCLGVADKTDLSQSNAVPLCPGHVCSHASRV